MIVPALLAVLALGAAGCAPAPDAAVRDIAADTTRARADSMALAIPDGAIWYTLVRDARAADGVPCEERGLEIRRSGDTVAVPLLYTRDVPTLLDDTTASARIYRDCAPGDLYRFDLRSGQPSRVR